MNLGKRREKGCRMATGVLSRYLEQSWKRHRNKVIARWGLSVALVTRTSGPAHTQRLCIVGCQCVHRMDAHVEADVTQACKEA